MELRRELSLMMGGLVLLNVLLAFGVIGLLVRMGPAIEQILKENVLSIETAEEVLVVLAESEAGGVSEIGRFRIRDALERLESNVTEPGEGPILTSIEGGLGQALSGDVSARESLVRQLRELIRVNRDAMNVADARAQRLGRAGAWSAVLVGVLSFSLSLLVLGRMGRRLVRPLLELHAALEAARQGEHFRRCHAHQVPVEIRQVLDSVNSLLDERLTREIS